MKGFDFSGIHAGIKKDNIKDMGLILCQKPASAAALFTKNRVKAAPVVLGQEMIKTGLCQAVLVNSGNANCFTGERGLQDARDSAQMVSKVFDIPKDLVMVSSTGVIGAYLPMDKFETGIPLLKERILHSGLKDFAQAILTTDTFVKIVETQAQIQGRTVSMAGVAKGSGMIRPDMATMLAYVVTDADIHSGDLKKMLISANEKSFHRISVDGDTSTNDTLLCLASGQSGVRIEGDSTGLFQNMLDQTCFKLAKMIVKDGEGATKTAQIVIKGARTRKDAFKAAEAIAHSNLVKTALYGQDPNWGRITAAAGRSSADVDPDLMDLFIGDTALVVKGMWQGAKAEEKAAQAMKNDEVNIVLDLNLGRETDRFLFCDFSENYVKINADYRT